MSTWIVVLIGLVVVSGAVIIVWWVQRRRTDRLRLAFGPEYDHALEEQETRWKAERELDKRLKERSAFQLRPASTEVHQRLAELWTEAEGAFVDSPSGAVGAAHGLLVDLLTERGYPHSTPEDRLRYLSVDHPELMAGFRKAERIRAEADGGGPTGEDLRVAMKSYKAVFDAVMNPSSREASRGS